MHEGRGERLSSRLTFVHHVVAVIPALFLGASTVDGVLSGGLVQVAISVLVGALLLKFAYVPFAWDLAHVWATDSGLVARRRGVEVVIPYASVQDAQQRHKYGLSEILLDAPTVFGRVVVYVPYLAHLVPGLGEHPANRLIRARARSAKAKRAVGAPIASAGAA